MDKGSKGRHRNPRILWSTSKADEGVTEEGEEEGAEEGAGGTQEGEEDLHQRVDSTQAISCGGSNIGHGTPYYFWFRLLSSVAHLRKATILYLLVGHFIVLYNESL